MSKKHYIAIAKILMRNHASDNMINDFCEYFKNDNFKFNSEKFKIFIKNLK